MAAAETVTTKVARLEGEMSEIQRRVNNLDAPSGVLAHIYQSLDKMNQLLARLEEREHSIMEQLHTPATCPLNDVIGEVRTVFGQAIAETKAEIVSVKNSVDAINQRIALWTGAIMVIGAILQLFIFPLLKQLLVQLMPGG